MTAQRKPIIVLDAGHGGQDPGAIGNGLKEKDITLDLTLRVGKLLKSRGATVLFTRGIDVFISLDDRAKMANQFKADFFCSIHVNAGGGAGGFESFVHSTVNGGATAAIQNVIHRKISKVFSAEGCPDRGQKKANLAVLRETNMPAILIEYGFIDVVKDACLLKNNAFLDRLATATSDGIAEALGLSPALPPDLKAKIPMPVVQGLCNVQVNGKDIVNGVIIDRVSYIPARALCDALKVNIGWDQDTRTVLINK